MHQSIPSLTIINLIHIAYSSALLQYDNNSVLPGGLPPPGGPKSKSIILKKSAILRAFLLCLLNKLVEAPFICLYIC